MPASHKRPVYIEMPHDMVDREIPIAASRLQPRNNPIRRPLPPPLEETRALTGAAKSPVILAGVELHRHRCGLDWSSNSPKP